MKGRFGASFFVYSYKKREKILLTTLKFVSMMIQIIKQIIKQTVEEGVKLSNDLQASPGW